VFPPGPDSSAQDWQGARTAAGADASDELAACRPRPGPRLACFLSAIIGAHHPEYYAIALVLAGGRLVSFFGLGPFVSDARM